MLRIFATVLHIQASLFCMKKLFFILALSLGMTVVAGAQTTGDGIGFSISMGGPGSTTWSDVFPSDDNYYTLAGIYGPKYSDETYSPVLSVGSDFILGRRLGLYFDLAWTMLSATKVDGVLGDEIGRCSVNAFYALPGIKLYWANKPRFKLYSGVGFGASGTLVNDCGDSRFDIDLASELIPLGFRFRVLDDKGFFFYMDSMAGRRISGVRVGVGYAF